MKNKMKYLGDPHKAKQRWLKKEKIEQVKKDLQLGKNLYKNAEDFWNSEYGESDGNKFSLSTEPSADLQKFVRWLERQYKGQQYFNKNSFVVDAGCGNGRNLLWLSQEFGVQGVGYDISEVAVKGANKKAENSKVHFLVQNLNEKIPCDDIKADLVVDAVASHVLRKEEREKFKQEVLRVLSSGSYYFLKSLLLDDDQHAKEMVKKYGEFSGEVNSYIHPSMGIFEHVPSEEELVNFYSQDFEIEKIERSFAHKVGHKANKRRYIVMYLRKR
jgi:SAM-dependent methyltransferase